MILSIIAAAVALTTTQSVDELEQACLDYQAEYGGEADCRCLAEAVEGDDEIIAAIADISGPDDLADAPEALLEAIADCS